MLSCASLSKQRSQTKGNPSVMPKMKTHKSAVKRFHSTGTGKLMHRHTKRAHSMIKKSPQCRRRLYAEASLYAGKEKAVSRQLPYGTIY